VKILSAFAPMTRVGLHPPSSEFPFHKAIYKSRPDIHGIVHAHPVALVAFSIIRQAPNTSLFHQARHVCGPVGFAQYALPGSEMLGRHIADQFRIGVYCVVLENHGVVVGGTSLQNAFQRFETLEFTAKTIIRARQLGPVQFLTDEQMALARTAENGVRHFEPSAADDEELELRRQLREFVRRGYQQRLLISTEGSFSARLDPETFLITPYEIDRHELDLGDPVLVRRGAYESGKRPSRAARIHRAIYDRHPEVHALVNAYPVHATAFSVTGRSLDSRTIPESYIFLRDVQRIPYGMQFTDGHELAERISLQQPVAILENDGVLVCGTSVLDAFDRLEVLESTAEALVDSHALGEVMAMPDTVIRELSATFFPKSGA
jgi:L-fuculose-phosphate aldolase